MNDVAAETLVECLSTEETAPAVRMRDVGLCYGKVRALDGITLDIPSGRLIGLIGPDGVGKSSLLSLISGARVVQRGTIEVLGGNIAERRHRAAVGPRIAYMPQGLGKNLYPTLSVFENIDFFGRLFGQDHVERKRRIAELVASTGLAPFVGRAAGKLSGGMKQKLGLCCALIHDPDLLILDEPTTGVDPLSRAQFWELIARIRANRPGMSVLVATAYMDEAARFDRLVAMDSGRVLAIGSPQELLARTGAASLEAAFVALLPREKRLDYCEIKVPPRAAGDENDIAIEAKGLTRRFGDFTAVDHVNFRIPRGAIFGFLGSNGCGKTTTMKMLTGLIPASDGEAWLFGQAVNAKDREIRRRVGYMSQAFSLYAELTVRQNLELHARLFRLPAETIPVRVNEVAKRFDLVEVLDALPNGLPLGQRQRLSLAVAMIHSPEMLILDEPTSGVDPVARAAFWQVLVELSRRDRVTIFISTHFMSEAEHCDYVSLMHAGKVLVSDRPATVIAQSGGATLEEAFIRHLQAAAGEKASAAGQMPTGVAPVSLPSENTAKHKWRRIDFRRMLSYARREFLELRRDPIRGALGLLGSVVMLFVMGYGISLDVEDLTFAVLDRDQTTTSRDYALNLGGSRYFIEQPPIIDYNDMDRRMRAGDLALAIELPPGFARDIARGRQVEVGAWIDGAMPMRAETVQSYVQGMHNLWLTQQASRSSQSAAAVLPASVETRFRYNPDVTSFVAMVPAVIPLLLLLIPSMLASLGVVREKELGSIVNLYVTPTTRLEFLLGKQAPYVLLGMLNFLLLTPLAVIVFGVPFRGSFLAFAVAALLFVICATAMGLVISAFMRSQIAAIFGTAILTLLPATQFSGMLDPVSSLKGVGAVIGQIYPMTHFLTISRGAFSKALSFGDLYASLVPLLIAAVVLTGLGALLLNKQDR